MVVDHPVNDSRRMRRKFLSLMLNNGSYIVGIVTIIVFTCISPYFLTVTNISGLLRDCTPLFCAATGLTFVVMSGKMDLSVGSVVLCSASIFGLLMSKLNVNPYLAIPLCILAGALQGAINGFFIAKLKMNPWLVTLSMKMGMRGLALYLTKSATIVLPKEITAIRDARLFGAISMLTVIALVIAAIMQCILHRTSFGRNVMAIGSNEAAASRIGINISQTRFFVYVICGALAAVAGILLGSNMAVVGTTSGAGYEFTCSMVIVLGGSSLAGGRGSVLPGTLVGVLIISALENGLYIVGINPYWFGVIRGVIIFYAMYMDSIKNKGIV